MQRKKKWKEGRWGRGQIKPALSLQLMYCIILPQTLGLKDMFFTSLKLLHFKNKLKLINYLVSCSARLNILYII